LFQKASLARHSQKADSYLFILKEAPMPSKRVLVICLAILFTMLFFADLAIAQMDPIYRFKGVNIPVRLKIKDTILEKSAYDLEFLRTSSPLSFFIKIMKGGKILDLLQGEEFRYDGTERDIGNNPDIPTKPTLKMSMNKSEKLLILVFESGIHHGKYPMLRARFKYQYEE
jgi:hypothetical protein